MSSQYGKKGISLLRELKRNELLPPFNGEAIRDIVDEMHFLHKSIEKKIDDLGETASEKEHAVGMFVSHQTNLRNKRCVLAYLMQRLNTIGSVRWEQGAVLGEELKSNMSPEELAFFGNYSNLISQYVKDTGVDLAVDVEQPPKNLYIEVRVLEEVGEIMTATGVVNLKANTSHFLRKDDVEQYIKSGKVKHVES